jgi:glycerol kinase
VPRIVETTALGAAYLAGLATGFWESRAELAKKWQLDNRYTPRLGEIERQKLFGRWHQAVERAKGWALDEE